MLTWPQCTLSCRRYIEIRLLCSQYWEILQWEQWSTAVSAGAALKAWPRHPLLPQCLAYLFGDRSSYTLVSSKVSIVLRHMLAAAIEDTKECMRIEVRLNVALSTGQTNAAWLSSDLSLELPCVHSLLWSQALLRSIIRRLCRKSSHYTAN